MSESSERRRGEPLAGVLFVVGVVVLAAGMFAHGFRHRNQEDVRTRASASEIAASLARGIAWIWLGGGLARCMDAALAARRRVERGRGRASAALKEIDTRVKVAKGDAMLAPVHAAITYTVRRALLQLAPAMPLCLAMDRLDRADYNPYAMGALDLFQDLYPPVSPDHPEGALAMALRQHAWFDFVVTVQACADTPKALDTAACDSEHALVRRQETKDNAWLLATLMTARQPSAADVPAADAARAVATDRPEWARLQFYAARVLHTQGHAAHARAMVEALAASPMVHKRDHALLEAESPCLPGQVIRAVKQRLHTGRHVGARLVTPNEETVDDVVADCPDNALRIGNYNRDRTYAVNTFGFVGHPAHASNSVQAHSRARLREMGQAGATAVQLRAVMQLWGL